MKKKQKQAMDGEKLITCRVGNDVMKTGTKSLLFGFTKNATRRAGAARTDASASTPVERLLAAPGASPARSSR